MNGASEGINLEKLKGLHGGYWRYPILDFHYLINPYFPPKSMLFRLRKDLPHLISAYPSSQKVISRILSKWKNQPYFNEENIIVTNGSSEAIRILNTLVTKTTIPIPTFNEYVQIEDGKKHLFLLREEDEFRLNVEHFIEAIRSSRSDFAVICNPNNPDGNLLSRDEVKAVLKSGVKLIIDEAFIDWCGNEFSCEDLVLEYENLIIIKSLTKVAGTAGLRLGYILTTNRPFLKTIRRLLPIWNVNAVAERFIELFPDYAFDFSRSLERCRQDKASLMKRLKKLSYLEPFESHGNFIFCKTDISAKWLGRYLFDHHRILIRDALNQETLASDRHVRLGVRSKNDNNKLAAALYDAAKAYPRFMINSENEAES
jgi:histidinol-phosphate/aromatic aminotransferase/cobyric acid decarboxylase-like protein